MPRVNENTEVSLPLRNMVSLIAGASIATWAYFGIVERLNKSRDSATYDESRSRDEYRVSYQMAKR